MDKTASDIILASKIIVGSNRGQAMDMLTDLVFDEFQSDISVSNGYEIDTILILLDEIYKNDPERLKSLPAAIEKLL